MKGEPSKSSITCQMDVWKTCVICGNLNNKSLMRHLASSLHLHVIVAYLKLSGAIPEARDFCSYDDNKVYECFVCAAHVDVPARALRSIYAFPPQIPLINDKCDPSELMRSLKKYMPPAYLEMTVNEFGGALPDSSVSESKDIQQCTCCSLLEETRRRLKTVLENAQVTGTSVSLNLAVFDELTEIKNTLNVEVKEKTNGGTSSIDLHKDSCADVDFLIKFENMRNKKPTKYFPSPQSLAFSPFQPTRNPISIIPPHKRAPRNDELNDPPPQDENQVPVGCPGSLYNFRPVQRTSSLAASGPQLTHDCARAIMNSSLIAFSIEEVRQILSDHDGEVVCKALQQLALRGLLYTHFQQASFRKKLSVFYLKEFRRDRTSELLKYGIIPEHYRQRLIGLDAGETVRQQFEKHRDVLVEMNKNPQVSALISTILSDSNNSDIKLEPNESSHEKSQAQQ